MLAYSVYGAPGCGKTTEVLERLESFKRGGVNPSKIGFMSFTKTAAAEALDRLGMTKSDNVSTIHSLCYRLNKINRNSVVDIKKLRDFSSQVGVPITGRSPDEEAAEGDQYLHVISYAENMMVPYEEAYYDSERPGSYDMFMAFTESYLKWKQASYFIDYNDMLKLTIMNRVKYNASHIIIDEAQDLSRLQWSVVHRLIEVANPEEVHIAGDDDQQLFRWSGAEDHGMQRFETKYSASRKILPKSWRLSKSVHRVAESVINRVQVRTVKKFDDRGEEGEVRRYGDVTSMEFEPGADVLILGRTHHILRGAEEELRSRMVAYTKLTGAPSPYDGKYADAIRAWDRAAGGGLPDDNLKQFSALKSLLPAYHRDAVMAGDFKFFKKEKWWGVLDVPPQMVEYYRNVDLHAPAAVKLSTIHGAKGREASHVILLTDMTDRVIESMEKDPDAEHRVFYVGVTRARDRLDIIGDGSGYNI